MKQELYEKFINQNPHFRNKKIEELEKERELFNIKHKKSLTDDKFLKGYLHFHSKGMIPDINEEVEEVEEIELSDAFYKKYPNLIKFRNPKEKMELKGENSKIKGQDDVLTIFERNLNGLKVANLKRTQQANLNPDIKFREKEGVLMSYVLAGTSGTGKTETAKQIAKILGYEIYVVSMGQMKNKEDVTNLIGPPPGTSSDNTGGSLTKYIKEHPQTIIVLDEMEKADPNILNTFMGILESGKFYDTGMREEIKFNKTIMFMTTNAGVQGLYNLKEGDTVSEHQKEEVKRSVIEDVFKGKFIDKMDGIAVFDVLTPEVIELIAKGIFRDKISEVTKMKKIKSLEITEEFRELCISEGYNIKYGARDLEKKIDLLVDMPLSELILQKKLISPTNLKIDYNEDTGEIIIMDENDEILNTINKDGTKDQSLDESESGFDYVDDEGVKRRVELSKEIVGQEKMVELFESLLQKDKAGLSKHGKPIASVLLGGPNGVGKTEISKVAAEQTDMEFIEIDMAQHQSLWSLVGPSKGYVGYEHGGELPNQIKEIAGLTNEKDDNGAFKTDKKFFIEFKNIDMADQEVLDIYLSMLDEGYFETPKDGKISMERAVIVLTTSQGGEEVINGDMKGGLEALQKNAFANRPEIKGRIGENNIIVANTLDLSKLLKITKKMFEEEVEIVKFEEGFDIEYDDTLILGASILGYEPSEGVRKLKRAVKGIFETSLGDLKWTDIDAGDKIKMSFSHKNSILKIEKEVDGSWVILEEKVMSIGDNNDTEVQSEKGIQIEYAEKALESMSNGGELNYDFIDYLGYRDFTSNGRKDELIGRTEVDIDVYKNFKILCKDLSESEQVEYEEEYFDFFVTNRDAFTDVMKKKNVKSYVEFYKDYKESYEIFNIYSYLFETLEFYDLGIEEIKVLIEKKGTDFFKDMKKNNFKKYIELYVENSSEFDSKEIKYDTFKNVMKVVKKLKVGDSKKNIITLSENYDKLKFMLGSLSYDNGLKTFAKKEFNENDLYKLREEEISQYENKFRESLIQEYNLDKRV